MAKIGENAFVNAIRRGVEEIHSFVTGKPVQEPVEAKAAEPTHEPAKAEILSFEHGLAEAARAPSKDQSRGMER